MSETRFLKHMKKLKVAGIVKVRKNRNGSRFAQNVYEVLRPAVSTSCRFEGMETQAPVLPSRRITGAENEGANSTSFTNTRGLSNTRNNDIERGFIEQICKLINHGKMKASSKGRIKVASGEWILDELIKYGISREEITAVAP